jgi:hypothetical protein
VDSRCKTGFSDLEESAKTRRQNGLAWLSFPLQPVAHAAHARLGLGHQIIKGWHTAVDQLIFYYKHTIT